MTSPDLITRLNDAIESLEAIEREARLGRARISNGEAVNGSSALQRCYEEARDARLRLAKGEGVKAA